jgi:hypothetical protein
MQMLEMSIEQLINFKHLGSSAAMGKTAFAFN